MGIISISYMQQALGTLLGNLENDNASEENCQLVKDLFAMSTKSLDQMGRAGAFHHIIRRKCAATDAGINNLNDIQAKRGGFGNKDKKDKDAKPSNSDQTTQQWSSTSTNKGDQITSVVLQNLGTLDFSNSIQYNPESSSYNGKEKHNCRLSEQEKNSAYRVVTEHSNCAETFSFVRPTSDGFICLGREPSDESVLLMDSTSPSFCLGCPDNILGENVCLRISPNLPDTQDIAIYEAVPVSDSPDSSFVAQETLVPGITSTIDRLPSQSPDTIRPSLSTEVPSLSSGPGGIQSDCLASINRSFQAEGFSKEARNLLSAS
ncbi:unnamed protein product [Mytilus coruscus]|uniref:Uncharacterized protein n=1 Tax=Mytilus coruscus TaxID=42192 RepID=A0A6J8DIM6_MYTCO|nr:unnamed protein product [Mytilus coruscus]